METVSLANKVYTENPLLDEIVYNARQIATGVILKDWDKANNAETLESIQAGDVLIAVKQGLVKFDYFKYTYDMIIELPGVTEEQALAWAIDNTLIPEIYRDTLLETAKTQYEENYVEYNNYYRMLSGLPDYDETGEWEGLWVDVNYIDEYTKTTVDHISKTYKIEWDEDLQKYTDYRLFQDLGFAYVNILYNNGSIEDLLEDTETLASWGLVKSDVLYLNHLGEKSVDYYTARTAEKFALLYCPPSDSEEVRSRFKDRFEANRLYLLYTVYSEAYKYKSDYYDNFMMVFLVIQTIIDMIIELPEYIIRRDIFDSRTCKYIFESNGVTYFKDIPLVYQIALVKNLNKLIKFKSTDKCILDIISIFGFDNIQAFRYYILKDRNVESKVDLTYYDNTKVVEDEEGNQYTVEDNDKNYDLKFVKVPLQGTYDSYIRKDSNIYSYPTVIEGDDYWLGDKEYATVESEVKDLDFTILRSKYYDIEAVIDLTKRNFTLVYFMNLIMYNKIDKSKLTVSLPNISTSKKFELIDTILCLYSLSYIYYGVEDTILDSRAKIAQILGFNMDADLARIADYLYENYNGYTFEDLGVQGFTVPEDDVILTFDQLQSLYFTNKNVYDHVRSCMIDPKSKEVYNAYRFIYKSMFIMNRNMEYFFVGDNEDINRYKALGYGVKFVNIPNPDDYTNPEDYQRDYKWFIEGLKDEFRVNFTYGEDTVALGKGFIELGELLSNFGITGTIVSAESSIPEYTDAVFDYDVYVLKWYVRIYKEFDSEETITVKMLNENLEEVTYVINMTSNYDMLLLEMTETFDTDHLFKIFVLEGQDNPTIKYMETYARMAETYREFLRYKDPTIYNFLQKIASIQNPDTRQEACVNAIQAIVSYLKDYIDQDGDDAIDLDDVFGGLPSISLDFIKNYVTEVVDFFKSFKIFTHASSIIYTFDDKFENYIQLIDWILLKYLLDKADIVKIEDIIEGKVANVSGLLLNSGNGLALDMSKSERIDMIDKVWFDISTWIQKHWNEYYNNDNYTETQGRIKDLKEHYSVFQVDDTSLEETFALDGIVKLLVDLTMSDTVLLDDKFSSFDETREFNDYYNEWMADLFYVFTVILYKEDKINMQDDMTNIIELLQRSFVYVSDGTEKVSMETAMEDLGFQDLVDDYYTIITQEYPAHVFDS